MTTHPPRATSGRASSFARIAAAYVVALGVAAAWLAWGPDSPWLWLDTLVADLLATLVVFVASRWHGNSSFYDAYWSVVPPVVAAYWWWASGRQGDPARFWLMMLVVLVWAVRLTANWARGFPGLHHEDWRYPLLREKAGPFELLVDLFAIHVVPTLQVFLGLLPAYVVATTPRDLGVLDLVALLTGLGAVVLEAVADLQMQRFARTARPGEVMDRGLWGWSRHPNYFGELGFWLSLALFGVAASPGDWWWLFLGTVTMLAMFEAASIPLMEERSLERRPEYRRVVDRVPRFVPARPGVRPRTGERARRAVRRPRLVVAGLGDTGVLTAIHLAGRVDVVGISPKPGLVSGQELGMRLARPDAWSREYRVAFGRFRRLDGACSLHGAITSVDLVARTVAVRLGDGSTHEEAYDVLVISTGVSNGFWRQPTLQSAADVEADLRAHHRMVAEASSVVVVGGGAAAVGAAARVAAAWPDKAVDLYFPGDRALPRHHGRVWRDVRRRLDGLGVGLHPGHRAALPDHGTAQLSSGRVAWSSGQAPAYGDVVVWAVGLVTPNTDWLPPEVLDDHGFVRVGPDLRVLGQDGVFAVGDVAATDPLRTSARNSGHRLLARNVRAHLDGRPLRAYRPPRRRWGSVLGPLHDGLLVFAPSGHRFRIPSWTHDRLLRGLVVRLGIYRGVRRPGRPHR